MQVPTEEQQRAWQSTGHLDNDAAKRALGLEFAGHDFLNVIGWRVVTDDYPDDGVYPTESGKPDRAFYTADDLREIAVGCFRLAAWMETQHAVQEAKRTK